MPPTKTKDDLRKALLKFALKHPETAEGIACKGTAVESPTATVGGKAFLFLGNPVIRFKLGESIPEITKLASDDPVHYGTGAGGWSRVTFGPGESAPLELLERWIGESYRLLAPKQSNAATKPGKKNTAKKAL